MTVSICQIWATVIDGLRKHLPAWNTTDIIAVRVNESVSETLKIQQSSTLALAKATDQVATQVKAHTALRMLEETPGVQTVASPETRVSHVSHDVIEMSDAKT